MRLLIVCGTRPEAVKLAPVIHQAAKTPGLVCRVCVTGQHREMLRQVLNFFRIEPDYDLRVMRDNQDLAALTGRILHALAPVLDSERPDIAMVQGDTVTSFAAALAAFYARIPVAHVEAGLRTHDLSAPFPEEGLRQLTARLAAIHFAPAARNMRALVAEGIPADRIVVTGNTVVDAVLFARKKLAASPLSPLRAHLTDAQIERVRNSPRVIMVTAHRRENFGGGLRNICVALRAIAESHPEVLIVYPVHPNPNVARAVERYLSGCSNILLTGPLDYPAFVCLMDASYFIVTDSGGVQEEAPSLGKPVLVLREATEREEAIETGQVRLVGADPLRIVAAARELLTSQASYRRMVSHTNPYGDGQAAARIVNRVLACVGLQPAAGPPLRPLEDGELKFTAAR
ncbi:MAG: non-hydrolyzing UDP-N-acetylglucosamine 2-epimerase [Bryobacteraceae bacterium]